MPHSPSSWRYECAVLLPLNMELAITVTVANLVTEFAVQCEKQLHYILIATVTSFAVFTCAYFVNMMLHHWQTSSIKSQEGTLGTINTNFDTQMKAIVTLFETGNSYFSTERS